MKKETTRNIGIAFIVTGAVIGVASLTPMLSTAVLGIDAVFALTDASTYLAGSLLGSLVMIGAGAGSGKQGFMIAGCIFGGLELVAILCCLMSGPAMIPQLANAPAILANTLNGRFLLAAGLDIAKLDPSATSAIIAGMDIGMLIAGLALCGAAIWFGMKLVNDEPIISSSATYHHHSRGYGGMERDLDQE